MARETTSSGFGCTTLIVPAGASNALLVIPQSEQVSMSLKYASGGSLEIFRAVKGGTMPTPAIVLGSGYPLGDSEIVNATGAPRFFLAATGATAVANLLIGISD